MLMEGVVDAANLRRALKRVRSNKGSPGVDGMTTKELPAYLKQEWPRLKEELLAGTYQPQPVKRVEIPKPGGGVRALGIPTVVDRFIQQAILQVLTPVYDPTFSRSSYGFRPGKSAHQALEAGRTHVASGKAWVVDLDLEKFLEPSSHCPHAAGEGSEEVSHAVHLLGHLDSEARLASSVDVDGAQLAALDTLQDGLAGDAQRLHRRAHRQPAGRRVLGEASAELVGQANLPGRAWRELLASQEAIL